MQRTSNYYWLSIMLTLLFLGFWSVSLMAQQELVLTIEPLSSSDKLLHFARAETLRTKMKFREAIGEYRQVILPGELCGKEVEAHYDIGICYAWLGKKDSAEVVFQQVIKAYADNAEVLAYSQYCLSWVDVQRGKFQPAIDRLQQLLDQNFYPDKEFCARAQFEIGRIYLVFLHQAEQAEQAFRKVLANYPDAEVANHPFLAKMKGN